MRLVLIFSLIFCIGFCSCASSSEQVAQAEVTRGTAFTGKVVYNDFEGGFWGIITKKGVKLHGKIPVNLQKKDLIVKGFYTVKEDVISMRMWGKPASFEKLQTP